VSALFGVPSFASSGEAGPWSRWLGAPKEAAGASLRSDGTSPSVDARADSTEAAPAASVTISREAVALALGSPSPDASAQEPSRPDPSPQAGTTPGDKKKLDEQAQQTVDDLKRRDREVRTHELAHKAAGGGLAGSINLTFERGPDGEAYAVGGSVPIDVSPVRGNPRATIQKMRQVEAAALAPASPSGPDRQIAASAAQNMASAQQELAKKEYAAQSGGAATVTLGAALAIKG
jgi:hypothetical protein